MANLRAIGCPEQTGHDIVVSRVCRRYRDQLIALEETADQAWDFSHNQSLSAFLERSYTRSELRNRMFT